MIGLDLRCRLGFGKYALPRNLLFAAPLLTRYSGQAGTPCGNAFNPFGHTLLRNHIYLAMSLDQHIRLAFNQDGPDRDDSAVGVAVQQARPELQPPPMYRVVMHNDDYTPMEFVVEILEVIFSMNRQQATRIMLAVHTEGRAVCGIYTRDVAETKAAQVNQYAKESKHPLLCEIERDV